MECSICFQKIKWYNKKSLSCGHVYHKKCLQEWFKKKQVCPYCRKDFSPQKKYSKKVVVVE